MFTHLILFSYSRDVANNLVWYCNKLICKYYVKKQTTLPVWLLFHYVYTYMIVSVQLVIFTLSAKHTTKKKYSKTRI